MSEPSPLFRAAIVLNVRAMFAQHKCGTLLLTNEEIWSIHENWQDYALPLKGGFAKMPNRYDASVLYHIVQANKRKALRHV